MEAQANGGRPRFQAGLVAAGMWQRLSFKPMKWSIQLNDVIRGVTNGPIRLTDVDGTIHLSCSAGQRSLTQDFYSGPG